MLINCDLTSALEDGGIGGLIVALAWIVKHFFFKSKPSLGGPPPSAPSLGR